MDITVWGAGAIGGITGGALSRAGHDVLLVDVHEEHVAALRRDGLTVEDARGDWHVPVRAATPAGVYEPLGLVLLAVKAQATVAALGQIVPLLNESSVIVSLQNGLNEEVIAERIGASRTVGCLVNWGADWLAPGRTQFGGTGSFTLGELGGSTTSRVRELAELLAVVQPTTVTENIWGCLWAKTCFGALLFATALTDETVYDVVERSFSVQRMFVQLVAEGMAVAEASGVRLEAFDEYDPALYRKGAVGDRSAIGEAMAQISRFYCRHTKVKTGVWRDLAVRKRKTEVDFQVGVVTSKARRLGIPTPLLDRLVAMIHDLEDGRRAMGWGNLDALVTLA
jgi:2-dehydropantoate 2-reductase